MNIKYMKVSLFEISYKKKWTFSRHSNLLRCTCISPHMFTPKEDQEGWTNGRFPHTKLKLLWAPFLHAHTSLTVLRKSLRHCAHIAKWVLFRCWLRFNGLKSLVLKIAMLKNACKRYVFVTAQHSNITWACNRDRDDNPKSRPVDKFQPDNCVYQYIAHP